MSSASASKVMHYHWQFALSLLSGPFKAKQEQDIVNHTAEVAVYRGCCCWSVALDLGCDIVGHHVKRAFTFDRPA